MATGPTIITATMAIQAIITNTAQDTTTPITIATGMGPILAAVTGATVAEATVRAKAGPAAETPEAAPIFVAGGLAVAAGVVNERVLL